MPWYRVQGKVVEAASPEAAKLQADIAGRDPLTKAAVGFATPFVEAAQGIKQLVQGKDYDPSTINQWRGAREGAGGWGTAGEAATWALPGGAGVKGVSKALPMAGKLLPAMVAGAAEQGGYEALRPSVGGDPSRAERGLSGAAWGAGGAATGQFLPRALGAVGKGFAKVSDEARSVIDQFERAGMKAPLSVGQTVGGAAKKVEDALAGYPGSGIVPGREKALNLWNTAQMVNTVRDAMRPALGDVVDDAVDGVLPKEYPAGHTGLRKMNDDINYLYGKIFDDASPPVKYDPARGGFESFADRLSSLTGEQAAAAKSAFNRLTRRMQEGEGLPSTQIKEVEAELREQASKAYQDAKYDLGDALDALKQDFRGLYTKGWTPLTTDILDATDELYARSRPIVQAASTQGALTRSGVFTPAQKLSRIRANARPSQLSSGNVPGQIEAEQANKVLGSSLPDVGPGTAEKLLGGGLTATAIGAGLGLVSPTAAAVSMLPMATGQALSSPGVARAITGQAAFQTPQVKALAEQIAQKFGVSAEVAAAWLAQQMNGASNAP